MTLIRNRLAEAGDWGVRNFTETPYVDDQNGEVYQMFTMTQAGYQFLVGRMTGKKAVEHQIAFIEAFNAMAAYIKNQTEGLQFQYLRKELAYKDRKGKVSGAATSAPCWMS